jgi:hypothetical protein
MQLFELSSILAIGTVRRVKGIGLPMPSDLKRVIHISSFPGCLSLAYSTFRFLSEEFRLYIYLDLVVSLVCLYRGGEVVTSIS